MNFNDACNKYIVEQKNNKKTKNIRKSKIKNKKIKSSKRNIKECNIGIPAAVSPEENMADSLYQISSQASEIMCYINSCRDLEEWIPEKICMIKQEMDNLHQFVQGGINRNIDTIQPAVDAAAIVQIGRGMGRGMGNGPMVASAIKKPGMPMLLGDKPAPSLRPVPLIGEAVKPKGTYMFEYPEGEIDHKQPLKKSKKTKKITRKCKMPRS